jgi:hypothetical protein
MNPRGCMCPIENKLVIKGYDLTASEKWRTTHVKCRSSSMPETGHGLSVGALCCLLSVVSPIATFRRLSSVVRFVPSADSAALSLTLKPFFFCYRPIGRRSIRISRAFPWSACGGFRLLCVG